MKIGITTIALNEQKFAQRWAKTTKDADYVLVADTGSVDQTAAILTKHDIDVVPITLRPWRFDDARNAALALLPGDLDVVIHLDLDETLTPGWREQIEATWTPTTTRLRYQYIWSWTATKKPDVTFFADKISGRHTHRWKAPVHEVLTPTVPEIISTCPGVLIEHHPDKTKPRSHYLPLLELAVRESPDDDRNAHYLGREYFFHARHQDAIDQLLRHLALPSAVWAAERAASMRYLGKSYEHLGDIPTAQAWFARAVLEDPQSREALIDAARFALAQNEFHLTIAYCQRALSLPAFSGDYMVERYARAEGAYDLMAVAFWHIGQRSSAIDLANQAVALNPTDPRLRANREMILQSKGV